MPNMIYGRIDRQTDKESIVFSSEIMIKLCKRREEKNEHSAICLQKKNISSIDDVDFGH